MFNLSEKEVINALKNGGTWNGHFNYGQPLTITYTFLNFAPEYYANTLAYLNITTVDGYFKYKGANLSTVNSISDDQIEAIPKAMSCWEAVANIKFDKKDDGEIGLLNVSLKKGIGLN